MTKPVLEITMPFERERGHQAQLDAWKCLYCRRVEFSYEKMVIHVAVEHGFRRLPKNG
jgi:hypothetical protein